MTPERFDAAEKTLTLNGIRVGDVGRRGRRCGSKGNRSPSLGHRKASRLCTSLDNGQGSEFPAPTLHQWHPDGASTKDFAHAEVGTPVVVRQRAQPFHHRPATTAEIAAVSLDQRSTSEPVGAASSNVAVAAPLAWPESGRRRCVRDAPCI